MRTSCEQQQVVTNTLPSPCSLLWACAGDGHTSCSPGLQLAELSGSYESEGPNRVACNEGASVAYPAGAPGFAYDPIGDADAPGSPHAVRPALPAQDCHHERQRTSSHTAYLDHLFSMGSSALQGVSRASAQILQGGLGSLRPVSVQDCQVACEMAQPACTSFAYNAVMAACFLKRGGGRATCISPTSICNEQVL